MEYINAGVVAAYLLGMVGFGAYLSRYVRKDEDFPQNPSVSYDNGYNGTCPYSGAYLDRARL